jgi:hypothetical protein
MQYHPIGVPFSSKSFYGIKERYIENFDLFIRFFPILENKKSSTAKSYVRKLEKRLADLVSAFNTIDLIKNDQRKLFYVESIELIDELLRYDISLSLLEALLLENDNSLAGQELLFYLQGVGKTIKAERAWWELFLKYRLWGLIRVEYFLKVLIITATVLTMAVQFKDIINSQFGK